MFAIDRLTASVVALVAALASGAISPALAQKPVVFYLMPTRIDEFQTESQKAIEVVLGELGYDVKSFDAADQSNLQLHQLDAAIAQMPAAIIINAVDFIAIMPGIAKANRAKIPILVYDRQLRRLKGKPEIRIDFSAIPDAYSIGQRAGEQIGRLLLVRYQAPNGTVLEITGDPGDDYSLEVQRGFLETIPRTIRVRSRAAIGWEPGNAAMITREELGAGKSVDLIFAHGAHLLSPLIEHLRAAQPSSRSVLLMSSNGAPVGLRNIRAGSQEIEIEQPLYAQVYGLAMGLRLILAGRAKDLTPRACSILGIGGFIENSEIGPILKLEGRVIDKRNVDDRTMVFWGNLVPPTISAQDISCGP